MLPILYAFAIRLYQSFLQVAALFHPKARLAIRGRRGWEEKLQEKLVENNAPIAWFHAASLGEFEQGRPVIEAFRQRYPVYKILLTFFSPSGYEVQKSYPSADFIIYLPFDTPQNAHRFVELVRPKIAFFIKYEFWYNYLYKLKTHGIPIISFSTIFRPNQVFFQSYPGVSAFYQNFLRCFDHVLVQNQESVDLLHQIGIKQVTRAGDTRFDRVQQVAANKKELPFIQDFKGKHPLLVIGSAWQADMDVLFPFLNRLNSPQVAELPDRELRLYPAVKVIIAPHEIHQAEIDQWCRQLNGPSIRHSQIQKQPLSVSLHSFSYYIIDNIGMLSSLYQYGEFAYIGGAFGRGLHNILEAATFGMPLFFGPAYEKFQEAVDLVREGAAFSVTTADELEIAFTHLYTNKAARIKAAHISQAYVERNTGATKKVMNAVDQLLA